MTTTATTTNENYDDNNSINNVRESTNLLKMGP